MGILSALNPFTFSRKHYAAWNALMAAYTLDQLSSEQKNQVLDKVVEIESSVRRRPVTLVEITAMLSEARLYHLYSLAMMNLGIRPALGADLWFEVKNPHVDLLDGTEVLTFTKNKLEKQFGVEFPELANEALHLPMGTPLRPPIEQIEAYVRWTLHYGPEFEAIRRAFFYERPDSFVEICVKHLRKYLDAADLLVLHERYEKVSRFYETDVLRMVRQRGGLMFCPEELKFSAIEVYVRVIFMNHLLHAHDALAPPLTYDSVTPLPV